MDEMVTKAEDGSFVYAAWASSQLYDTGDMETMIALKLIIMSKMVGKEETVVEPEQDVIVDP